MNAIGGVATHRLFLGEEQESYASGVKESACIFNVNSVDSEPDEFPCLLCVVLIGVDGTNREYYPPSGIQANFLSCSDGDLHVPHIVERVIRRVVANSVGVNSLSC